MPSTVCTIMTSFSTAAFAFMLLVAVVTAYPMQEEDNQDQKYVNAADFWNEEIQDQDYIEAMNPGNEEKDEVEMQNVKASNLDNEETMEEAMGRLFHRG